MVFGNQKPYEHSNILEFLPRGIHPAEQNENGHGHVGIGIYSEAMHLGINNKLPSECNLFQAEILGAKIAMELVRDRGAMRMLAICVDNHAMNSKAHWKSRKMLDQLSTISSL